MTESTKDYFSVNHTQAETLKLQILSPVLLSADINVLAPLGGKVPYLQELAFFFSRYVADN